MLRLMRSLIFCAIAVTVSGVIALGQSNLTAKASTAQPIPAAAVEDSDRLRDGLVGPVRRVRTEVAKLSNEGGKPVEAKHAVLEVVSYDIKGHKVENQYFPIAGANLTGKEVYKYDDKGNISEMTLLNADGSLMSKEVYKYEFDFAGNWNKMTTSVAVIDGGKLSFEPSEITYRSIMYYLDENMLKMASQPTQPAPTTTAPQNVPVSTPANNTAAASLQPKSTEVAKPANNTLTATQKSPVTLPGTTLPGASTRPLDKVAAPVELASARGNSTAPVVDIEAEPPVPATADPKPILKPVSGGVLNGMALSLPSPSYPEAARRMRIGGIVSVDVVVDETGKVISAVATSGSGVLRDGAVQAAMRAKFSPTKLSGQPVKVSGTINYKFALTQ